MKYLDFPIIKVYYKLADTKRVYKNFTSYISYLHTLRRAIWTQERMLMFYGLMNCTGKM